ncbi:PRC-barrel domain containing protein [Kitasatospora terrestris]|uniref:PRC domain containing protein n=1 Tax=Kitasatospora terrestris TaxID=258051 RepID=A0ABP9EQJ7_9ACTN
MDLWEYRDTAGHRAETDLVGYHVEATDGPIGRIDKLSDAMGARYLVVDTGPWIFGKLVLLPACTVVRIDPDEHKVHVDRSKEDIKNGPELGVAAEPSREDRERHALYYTPFYGGRQI